MAAFQVTTEGVRGVLVGRRLVEKLPISSKAVVRQKP
jgi:hypothetical protein